MDLETSDLKKRICAHGRNADDFYYTGGIKNFRFDRPRATSAMGIYARYEQPEISRRRLKKKTGMIIRRVKCDFCYVVKVKWWIHDDIDAKSFQELKKDDALAKEMPWLEKVHAHLEAFANDWETVNGNWFSVKVKAVRKFDICCDPNK